MTTPRSATAQSTPPPTPGRRDPEGRQRAIISAAATLITEGGLSALTHRAVAARAGVSLGSTTQYFSSLNELREAAYQLLADEIDAELHLLKQRLTDFRDMPTEAAQVVHEFLTDGRQVRAEIALLHAGTTDPTRRSLALRWFDQLIELLSAHIGREAALAIAVYLDGATVHAGLHDTPLDVDQIARALAALATLPNGAKSNQNHPSPECGRS